ncbi:type II toxin-antitoxin system RelE/ParE family toxin [Niveispirillum sp. KHB5.9]|uniref:type II toxin-antitoxin system RelE/ParE family toxin n=1 Tax=Niveispirillum sp. KHB5.9 TaxID=3400269 RepID=UPI003A874800
MARYRLAPAVRSDVVEILAHSEINFGSEARRRYRALLEAAFALVADRPQRLGAIARPDLGNGYMAFHLRHCPKRTVATGRVLRPRHMLFYRIVGPGFVDILRVLHDRMEAHRHLED